MKHERNLSKEYTKNSDFNFRMKNFYVSRLIVASRFLTLCVFMFLEIGCMLSSSLVIEKGESTNPENQSPTSPISFDPDMIVIGQPNWYAVQSNFTYDPKVNTLSSPRDMVKIGNKYFVTDYDNQRIIVFENSISGTPSIVLGQPNFNSGIINNNNGFHETSARGFLNPTQIASNGTQLAIADANNNRVLIWNSIPTTSFQSADIVIGQVDFQHRLENRGESTPNAGTLWGPTGVIFVGQKLVIADRSNHRLLIYNSIPNTNGVSADFVVGQADFYANSINRTGSTTVPSNKSLYFPYYLSSDGTRLLVGDGYNNRVLIWNSLPNSNDTPADVVIGQTSFTSNTASTSQSGLNRPRHMLIVNGSLYISDTKNNRIVYHSTIPSSPGASATAIFGQALVTQSSANRG